MLTEMTAIIIVYLIVLAATIYLGYRLNVLRWKKRQSPTGRLCNDGQYRCFTKEHDDMIERNTLKYRQMKFGGVE